MYRSAARYGANGVVERLDRLVVQIGHEGVAKQRFQGSDHHGEEHRRALNKEQRRPAPDQAPGRLPEQGGVSGGGRPPRGQLNQIHAERSAQFAGPAMPLPGNPERTGRERAIARAGVIAASRRFRRIRRSSETACHCRSAQSRRPDRLASAPEEADQRVCRRGVDQDKVVGHADEPAGPAAPLGDVSHTRQRQED